MKLKKYQHTTLSLVFLTFVSNYSILHAGYVLQFPPNQDPPTSGHNQVIISGVNNEVDFIADSNNLDGTVTIDQTSSNFPNATITSYTPGGGSAFVALTMNDTSVGQSSTFHVIITHTDPHGAACTTSKDIQYEVDVPKIVTPAGDPLSAGNGTDGADGQNQFTFKSMSAGVLTLTLKATIPGTAISQDTEWKFQVDDIGNSTKAWDSANPDGQATLTGRTLTAKVTFTNLPVNNSDFGRKTAKLIYSSISLEDHVQVATNDYAVFFPKLVWNHPGAGSGDVNFPNWYYYWKDGGVCGITSSVVYDDSNTGYGLTTPGTSTQITLGKYAPLNNDGPETYTGSSPYGSVTVTGHGLGIKCVAETIQHEQHHLDIYSWYGAGIAANPSTDADGDGIPATAEATLDSVNSDPNNSDTFNMGSYGTSGSHYQDNEIRARKVELTLTIPIHPELDWANPGCQTATPYGP